MQAKMAALSLSFLLYLLSKRGQVRLYDFRTSPFIASLVHVLRASTIRMTKAAIFAWIQTTVGQKLDVKVDKKSWQ